MICDEDFTEGRWLAAHSYDDAAWMVRRIWQDTALPSVRKSQLFACGCARHVWHLLSDERCRHAVQIAERYADGFVARSDMVAAAEIAVAAIQCTPKNSPQFWASVVAGIAAYPRENRYSDWKASNALWQLRHQLDKHDIPAKLMRDIFGNPFRPVVLNPLWRTSTVLSLSQAIYDERAFDRLPVLGDSLEDSGCDNADVLTHCRSQEPHVPGCWVIDLILSKDR